MMVEQPKKRTMSESQPNTHEQCPPSEEEEKEQAETPSVTLELREENGVLVVDYESRIEKRLMAISYVCILFGFFSLAI